MATNKRTTPIIPNPVLIDRVLGNIQTGLMDNVDWLDVAFGRAQRIAKVIQGKRYYTPNVYAGGTEWLAWKGMETDGGTVPDLFEGWFRPFGYGLAGFVIHDAICLSKEVSRSEANRVLKEILYKLGDLKSIDVEMIYYAVEAYRLKMGLD